MMNSGFLIKAMSHFMLILILMGVINSPDQIPGEVDAIEFRNMCGAVMIENGNETGEYINDTLRVLLTSSVIQNRIDSPNWHGNNVEEVVLAKDGGYIQYAPVTRNGFKTKEATPRVQACCKFIMLYGPICPANVVYQGQTNNGSGEYKRIPVKGDKDEIFCYE